MAPADPLPASSSRVDLEAFDAPDEHGSFTPRIGLDETAYEPPRTSLVDEEAFTRAPSLFDDAHRVGPDNEVPSPIPAQAVPDPGPFSPANASVHPLTADPFAGSFHPGGPGAQPDTKPGGPHLTMLPPLAEPVQAKSANEVFPDSTGPETAKSFMVTWLLAWLVGVLGVDRFYLGKTKTGVVKLVTLGGLGVWAVYDLFLTLLGHQTAQDGSLLDGYDEHKTMAWIATLGVWVVFVAVYLAVVVFSVF